MSILRRPKTNTRRKNLLLVAVALVFVVPCVAASPFALRIAINQQSDAVASEDTVVAPDASVMPVQQGARQKYKLEERTIETERKRQLRRLEQLEMLKRQEAELERQLLQNDAVIARELEAKLKETRLRQKRLAQELEANQKAAHLMQERQTQELEAKQKELGLRQERQTQELEAKQKELGLRQERRTQEMGAKVKKVAETLEQKVARERLVAKKQAELAKKASITMQQAIQIALSQQAGRVIECHLIENQIGDKDQVFYSLTIVSGDEPQSASTHMLISAVDGRVVATRKY